MATSFATFYDAFKDLEVTGVTSLDEPPLSVPTAQIPCKWVDIAGMDGGPFMAKSIGGWPTLKARVVVLMEPIGQNRNENRWSDALAMMDTLNDAITGMTRPCAGHLSWSIGCEPNFAGDKYFAVVATVEGEG